MGRHPIMLRCLARSIGRIEPVWSRSGDRIDLRNNLSIQMDAECRQILHNLLPAIPASTKGGQTPNAAPLNLTRAE